MQPINKINLNSDKNISPSHDQYTLLTQSEQYFDNLNMKHFEIVKSIGKGKHGELYKAKDLTLERFVVIKLLFAKNTTQILIQDEVKTISQLNHPNIVDIYDVSRDVDANVIVMEWVNGQPLNTIIPADGMSVNKVLAYAKQMVSAIACAHQQEIIHRDIKPQNIMLDEGGRIKILGFGITAIIESVESLTVSNATINTTSTSQHLTTEIIGTLQYMSPEKILGQALDTRSDLFSLGIVLYEMLTGVKPFLGENVKDITQAITSGQYTPIAAHKKNHDKKGKSKENIAVAPELIAIVDKLLQLDPKQRYQSTQTLAQEINVLDHSMNRKSNWRQKKYGLTKAILAMLIVIILAWGIASIIFPSSTQELVAKQLIASKKIAFLPFNNLSGDPVLQLFSDGVATMLSSDLAEVAYQQDDATTWVVPASEIRKLESATVAGVYNQYGVDVVITGSIQHAGLTRSLHLSLVNGVDGEQLRSLQMSIDAKDLFAAQKKIRQQVLNMLGWHIPQHLAEQFTAKKPSFDGAYKYYLEGQGYLYRFDYQDNIEKAALAFTQAITLDAHYGDAYVGLAQTQLRRFIEYQNPEHLTAMATTVQHLMQIDSTHRLINYLFGELMLQQGQYQAAVLLFKTSIMQHPHFMKAYTSLAEAHQNLRDLVDAEKVLLTAYQLKPNNNEILANLGAFYYRNGNYLKAITYFELLAKQAPNNYTAYLNISACYYLNGDFQQAIIAVEKALAIQPHADGYANLGTYYFMLRNYKQSVVAFEKMIALNNSDYLHWGNLADAYRFAKNNKHIQAFHKAILLAEQVLALNPNNRNAISSLAYYYANINNIKKTKFYSEKITVKHSGVEHFFVAAAYARINMKEEAIQSLVLAIENNYSVAEIRMSPLFDSLKEHPDHIKLLSSLYP